MKKLKKFTAVLLCVALLLTLSVNTSAETADIAPVENNSGIVKNSDLVQTTDGEISTEPISQDETVSTLSATEGIISGAVYRIRNIGSNKYMNVHYGVDADSTNIYQWTADGSTEQKFRVVYFADSDTYKLYAMCSSSRVVSVARGSSSLASGQNVYLYTANDATAQGFNIVSLGQSQFHISMKENPNLYLTAYGDSNGTSGGTGATSAGNIFISNYAYTMHQYWTFELVENPSNPVGNLEEVSSTKIKGWAYQTGLPDTPIQAHIYVKNNSTGAEVGYATFADQYRPDLYAAGIGDGYHAFDYSMNWCSYPSGTYTVSAYGINAYGGTNPHLGNSPRTFTVRKATGTVDSLSSTGVSGWAWKSDAPNSIIQVHLYIRRLNGETVYAYPVFADIYRPDLYAAGYGNGVHGYSIPIDWSTLPEEKLRVTLYAVDGSGENPAFYDGYYENGSGTTPMPTPTTAYIWPTVSKRITQMYNSIPPYTTGHYGIDIGAVTRGVAGDPIYCVMDGYVVRNIPLRSTYGYGAYINHINPDQSISTYLQTRYAHMMSASSVVAGTNITKGTVIGYMGNTGKSDGVHLHFETRITPVYERLFSEDKSYCINPLTYYDSNGNALSYNANNNDSSDNPWGLIFDINDIEIDRYGEVEKIDIEEPISP